MINNWKEKISTMPAGFRKYLEQRSGKQVPRTCVLCNSKSDLIGLFELDERGSRAFGALPGKHRVIAYGLCISCGDLPDATQRIENALFDKIVWPTNLLIQ